MLNDYVLSLQVHVIKSFGVLFKLNHLNFLLLLPQVALKHEVFELRVSNKLSIVFHQEFLVLIQHFRGALDFRISMGIVNQRVALKFVFNHFNYNNP